MSDHSIELSIVIPCLSEEKTLAAALRTAREAIEVSGMEGEILIADNGSMDGSCALAEANGARVVHVQRRGYGFALAAGVRAAKGPYIIMGDADATYDFREAVAFVNELRAGADLVVGSRLRGRIEKGAMPFLHRYLGTPVLTALINLFFGTQLSDCNGGLRAFTRSAYERMKIVSGGMEFASEMLIKSALAGLKIVEIPCSLWRDTRDKPPHLKTWRDGWRHLRFILLFAPHIVFTWPGWVLLMLGLIVTLMVLPRPLYFAGIRLDYHHLFYSIPMLCMGYQALWYAHFERCFVRFAGLLPEAEPRAKADDHFPLEGWLLAGGSLILVGLLLWGVILVRWFEVSFGSLAQIRHGTAAMLCMILGLQTIMNALIVSMMELKFNQLSSQE
jgi:glycosyltransferase involved in cell wall biosynthesis